MQNKYVQALIAAVIYAIVFPFLYRTLTNNSLAIDSIAVSTAIFFFFMLAYFSRKKKDEKRG
ncbi:MULTISPECIES: hypothetical protein [unclassified Massilia]|uniref:hypothetical protein n=1 Tax=unclassified Massilia TaxID=2609279 RepID=UPI001B83BA9D|nr:MULTISPECIES: hypothetical protein [unclassified Massilia]MBQ5938823.1 hypothetical protein [Massilia sp. AB1]MBQ5962288.1 hypothetical protein [Massilia sp. ZL223]